MCGLCGVVDLGSGPVTADELRRMDETLVRRGPDQHGAFVAERAGLSHRRLSILDLAGGRQPMAREDGLVQVVHNGEIYNFVELREELERLGHRFRTRSDSEVILHGYVQWGDEVVERLDGMFALAVWDASRSRLLLARDRFGKKPLAWFRRGGRFVFASTLTALLRHPACPRDVDGLAFSQYLAFEFVPAPRTILEGVHKLRPGHLLSVERDGSVRERRYFRLNVCAASGVRASAAEHDEEILRRLREAVRKRLVADVPVGVLLSGGLDSSSVAAMAAELSSRPIRTFFIGFEEPSFDETRHARAVARRLGAEHTEETLGEVEMRELVPRLGDILDEPLADSSLLPTYLVSRLARRDVTVVLSGDGGDELFGGYPTYLAHRLLSPLQRWLSPRRVAAARRAARVLPVSHGYVSFDYKVKRTLEGLDFPPAVRNYVWNGGFLPTELSGLVGAPVDVDQVLSPIVDAYRSAPGTTHLERVLSADVELNLGQRILTKVDRASMENSLEVRAPLLDTDLATYVAALPLSEKLRLGNPKVGLKRAMRARLPERTLARRKKGFGAPVGRWLRGPLAATAHELLLGPNGLSQSGLVDPKVTRDLLDVHRRGSVDHRKRIWPLLVFELWRRAHLGGAR